MKLRDYAKTLGLDVGCGDNSCIWGAPDMMGTNGGCRCGVGEYPGGDGQVARLQMRRFAKVARAALDEVERAGQLAKTYAAEVERLRKEAQHEHDYADATRDAMAEVQASSRERHAVLLAKLNSTRAEVERMRPVVEMARRGRDGSSDDFLEEWLERLDATVDAYEAATSSGGKVGG